MLLQLPRALGTLVWSQLRLLQTHARHTVLQQSRANKMKQHHTGCWNSCVYHICFEFVSLHISFHHINLLAWPLLWSVNCKMQVPSTHNDQLWAETETHYSKAITFSKEKFKITVWYSVVTLQWINPVMLVSYSLGVGWRVCGQWADWSRIRLRWMWGSSLDQKTGDAPQVIHIT